MDPARRLRIATYNVHSCVGADGRHDPERVARVIDELDADVVALQEFSYPADIALETRTPVVLTELDEYQCALGPTLMRRARHFGNVLLSRHPIRELQRLDLSHGAREPRGALAATIDVGGVELHVLATHLGLKLGERRFQVARIVEHLASVRSLFFVVLGDFNDWLPGRSVVHVLDERLGPAPRPRTFPVSLPLLSLDRVWVQPKGALREVFAHSSSRARRASDHLPGVAVVDAP
jgi:endonuclease/exonuclease/phosphatase family metal-dependent hydrolase